MKPFIRKKLILLLALLLFAAALLPGCGKKTQQEAHYEIIDGKIVEVRPGEDGVIHEGYDTPAPAPGEASAGNTEITDGVATWQDEEYNSLAEGDPNIERLKARLLTVCDAAREAYLAADKGSTMNVTLSVANLASMLQAIGNAGYPAQDSNGLLNMQACTNLDIFARMADELHFSVGYFGDLIKKETGQNIKDYIIQAKVEAAKDLLARSDIPVSLIAMEMGYDNFSHFTQIFKKICGVTPSDYRREARDQR